MTQPLFNPNPQRQQTEREPLTLLRVPMPIDIVQLQTTVSTIFTAVNDFQITGLYLSNVTASGGTATIHLVPSGGTADITNMILSEYAVGGRTMVNIFNETNVCMMQPGSTLQALCDLNDDINIWGHGYNYQGQYST